MADIRIETNFQEVRKQLDGIRDELQSVQAQQERNAEATEAGTAATGKLAKGFRGVGLALKTAGIGLALEVFNALKTALGESQVAVDFFSTAANAAGIVISDLVDVVTNGVTWVREFVAAFELPSFQQIGDAIKENLQNRFNAALDVLGFLGDAARKFFSGDFAGALDSAKMAGSAYVDVLTGVPNTLDKVGEATNNLVTTVTDYGKQVVTTAKAQTQLNNAATIAAATNAKLRAEYEAEQEALRRTRDDVTLTAEERLEASRQLNESIEESLQMREKLAQAEVDAAQAAYDANPTIENQTKLIEAQTKQVEVLAETEGKRSEQNNAHNALEKEIDDEREQREQAAFDRRKQRLEDELLDIENENERRKEANRLALELLDEQIAMEEDEEKRKDLILQRDLERNRQRREDDEITAETKEATLQAGLEAASAVGDALTTLAGENKGLAIAGLLVEQASGIASTVISTVRGVQQALAKGPAGVPEAILIGTTGAAGVASAIAATVQGINQINATPGPAASGVAGGGGASSVPFGPTAATPRTPSGVQVSAGQGGASEIPIGTTPEPIMAVVSEGSIQDAQERAARTRNKRKFGSS